MATFPGTYIPTGQGSNSRLTGIIDNIMTPRLLSFRQITIGDVTAYLCPDHETWRVDFGNWLEDYPVEIRKNGEKLLLSAETNDINYELGTFKLAGTDVGLDGRPRDTVEVNYQFDYFPAAILEPLINVALMTVNSSAVGSMTGYSYSNSGTMPPLVWDSVVSDLAFAMCMERLLLDYDLWKYRLVYAINPNDNDGPGNSDIASQLELLKKNAEERAARTLENPKFKAGNYVAAPTSAYYASVRLNGLSTGAHGIPFVSGRLRGWKPNQVWAQ
jgi:hypothetical protein